MSGLSKELELLKAREEHIIWRFRHFHLTHGKAHQLFRVFKGLLLGFALGSVMAANGPHSLTLHLITLMVAGLLSFILVHFQRRHYNRGHPLKPLTKSAELLIVSCIISLIVFTYSNFGGYVLVVALTWLFASVTYSLE